MNLLFQIWGGAFYLANKILFAAAAGRAEEAKRKLLLAGWAVYILGVPAWIVILVGDRNWIAASIEAGGVPAMLFGLFNVYQRVKIPSRRLDLLASFFTYASLLLGVGYSLWERNGLTSLSQILEIGVMIGFLLGSYLMAKDDDRGWLFFMLMNGSMAALMLIEEKPILTVQQLVSLSFVIYGFITATRSRRHNERRQRNV